MVRDIVTILIVLVIIGGGVFIFRDKEVIITEKIEDEVSLSEESIVETSTETTSLVLTSPAFEHNSRIPSLYTCDGDDINPPFKFSGIPEEAFSLVFIMDDPDISESAKTLRGIEAFDHWVIYNIPPDTVELKENSTPPGVEGIHGAGSLGYFGSCPPDGEHNYSFKLYALDTELDLSEGATKVEVIDAMEGHILEQSELIGHYDRS